MKKHLRLTLLLLSVLISLVQFGFLFHRAFLAQLEANREETFQEMLSGLEPFYDQLMDHYRSLRNRDPDNAEALQAYLDEKGLKHSTSGGVYLRHWDDHLLTASGLPTASPLMRKGLRPDAVYISPIYERESDGLTVITLYRSLSTRWQVAMDVPLTEVCASIRPPADDRSAYLIDGETGRILYHPNPALVGLPTAEVSLPQLPAIWISAPETYQGAVYEVVSPLSPDNWYNPLHYVIHMEMPYSQRLSTLLADMLSRPTTYFRTVGPAALTLMVLLELNLLFFFPYQRYPSEHYCTHKHSLLHFLQLRIFLTGNNLQNATPW